MDDRVVARRLTELSEGWTQQELAVAAGMDPTALSKILSGARRLSVAELIGLATALDEPIDRFLESENDVAFAMRANEDDVAIKEAVGACSRVIDEFLTFDALVG